MSLYDVVMMMMTLDSRFCQLLSEPTCLLKTIKIPYMFLASSICFHQI